VSLIEIVPAMPAWSTEFEALASVIRQALGPLALRVDHIGSTSVPGLAAKDVIDIQVTVRNLDDDALVPALATIGYTTRTDIVGDHVPPGYDPAPNEWRKRYFRAPAGQRPTHLHMRELGRANQRYPLLFRDYLRANPAASTQYAAIKVALARICQGDVEAYYDVKDPVCDLIMQAAEAWLREGGPAAGH